jgi:hypothetical protein
MKEFLANLLINCILGSAIMMMIVLVEAVFRINQRKPAGERYKYPDPWSTAFPRRRYAQKIGK